jgi:catechol 2,3-dioxygenase-like lactoylglutathione lyase family enzyme
MKRTWTIIGVSDVPASFKWYQSLFGQPETAPAHDYFGQILDTDGTVLLCLHAWGEHDHRSLTSPDIAQPGNGLLLFFRVDDYDDALLRARSLVAQFEEEPHLNPSTETMEFSLRDPDGYYVTISAL